MVDIYEAIQSFMNTPGVTAQVDDRVFLGASLPEGYEPRDGPAVLFNLRGGPFGIAGRVLNAAVVVRCYALTDEACIDLWRVCADEWLNRKHGTVTVQQDTLPQLLREPSTGWLFSLTFWTFWVKNH